MVWKETGNSYDACRTAWAKENLCKSFGNKPRFGSLIDAPINHWNLTERANIRVLLLTFCKSMSLCYSHVCALAVTQRSFSTKQLTSVLFLILYLHISLFLNVMLDIPFGTFFFKVNWLLSILLSTVLKIYR